MRRVLVGIAIVVGLAGVAEAEAVAPEAAQAAQPAAPEAVQPAEPAQPDGGAVPGARREPGRPEMMYSKPSGFGLPNIPAKGGAYRYRLMLVGVAVLALTLTLTIRYLRKVARQRAAA
jgi:hypothetical protein